MLLASAAFLTGLVLLAVPIWLHRLKAHAAEQRTFSSLFLMRATEAPVNMRRQLQHLWLLIARLMLVAVACFAFAEPLLELAGEGHSGAGPAQNRLIVLDRSLSMDRVVAGVRAIDSGRQKVGELIDALPVGARAALVVADDQIELTAPFTADRSLLRTAVAAVQPGTGRLRLDGLLGRINNLAGTLLEPGERMSVHLVSDFQATGMPDQFNALIQGSGWPAELHAVGDVAANFSVVALRPVTTTETPQLEVTVAGFSNAEEVLDLVVEQNGATVGSRTLTVPPEGTGTARFTLPAPGRGPTTWLARLEKKDALAADNVRRGVLMGSEEITLPVFAGDDRSYAYLRAAVRAAAPRFVPRRISAGESSADIASAPVIVVLDPGEMSGGSAPVVERYMETGGAVLLTAGPATRASGRLPLVDAALSADRFEQTGRGVVAVDRSHPVLAGFGEWQDLTVFRSVKIVEGEATAGEVIVALDDNTPLLTEYAVGAGRLLVLATALDPQWSSLVVRPAFVGFTANALSYLAEDLLPVDAVVGQPFAIPAQSVQLFDARGDRVLGLADTVGRPTVSLGDPGVYQLRTPSSSRLLAVNADVRESDLRRASEERLSRWQAATSHIEQDAGGAVEAGDIDETTYLLSLAPWLLGLLVLLVLFEPLLANVGSLRRPDSLVNL